MKRIGPNMLAAVDYVRRHPGCAIIPVADHISPSRAAGYASVHRAIRAGLIRNAGPPWRYELHVPEADGGSQAGESQTGAKVIDLYEALKRSLEE